MLALRLTLTLALAASILAQDERPPNIVLVLADDLGIGDVGAYNPGSKIPTPHLDRVAAEGMRMTDAHSPSAVCTPTRYGVLTGRYCWRSKLKQGVLNGRSPNLIELDRLTLPELLQARGYHTGCIGKWHLGLGSADRTPYTAPLDVSPLDHGFDHFYGIPASLDMEPYVWVLGRQPVEPATEQVAASGHRRQGGGGFWRAGEIAPDFRHVEVLPRLGERAVEFVERAVRDDATRPFFLYLPLSAPHTPWLPTEAFQGRTEIGHYGDFVAQVDQVVGDLLAALDRMQVAGDTLLIVTSDNGSHWPRGDVDKWGHDANLGFRGQKADIHEGGHRVPFLVRWPGATPPGTERNDLLGLTDLMASLAVVAGADLPDDAGEDSVDQSAVWRNAQLFRAPRTELICHSLDGMFALRDGPWKLIEGLGSGGFTGPKRAKPTDGGPSGQLYHLLRDPAERTNLWAEEPERVKRMSARLEELRAAGRSR